jgi:hypothetical protein
MVGRPQRGGWRGSVDPRQRDRSDGVALLKSFLLAGAAVAQGASLQLLGHTLAHLDAIEMRHCSHPALDPAASAAGNVADRVARRSRAGETAARRSSCSSAMELYPLPRASEAGWTGTAHLVPWRGTALAT